MPKLSPVEIVACLNSYRMEAENARNSGWNDRDTRWKDNIDLYFNRFDFSNRAEWQSQIAMPEASLYIDRWAAALRAALIVPGQWFTLNCPPELEPAYRKFLQFYLDRCGTLPTGQWTSFGRVFEDQAKLAALMACAGTVTWESRPIGGGRCRVDSADPREVLLDPTGRCLYRCRRSKVDYYQLLAEAKANPGLYDMDELENLGPYGGDETDVDKEDLIGHGTEDGTTARRPILKDEYLAVILDDAGNDVYGGRQLCVVANGSHLIRGPEPNPYWHGNDWTFFAPAITVPLSVYGRTYVETWGDIAKAFVAMTNLILDAGYMAAMKAFAMQPEALQDADQAKDGIYPNKVFLLQSGNDPSQFIQEIDLGNLSTAAVEVWQALKHELREGAATNDLDLGQSVPKGDVTATEISEVRKGGSDLIKAIAASLEEGCVDVILNLVFQTALQHISEDDTDLRRYIGEEYFNAFLARRQELAAQPPSFQARGISGLIDRQQKLSAMLQIVQALGSSQILQQALLQSMDFIKFVNQLIILLGLDPNEFAKPAMPIAGAPPGMPGGSSSPGAAAAVQQVLGSLVGSGGGAPPPGPSPANGSGGLPLA